MFYSQDVLVFDATKIGTDDYSLHRTGMDIESFDAYYVELEEATYEVKARHLCSDDWNTLIHTLICVGCSP